MSDDGYLKHRDLLNSAEMAQSQMYDRSLLNVAGGALALSVTFIKEIVHEPVPATLSVLALSWISLTLSIAAILGSLLSSQSACRAERRKLDAGQNGTLTNAYSSKNVWSALTHYLNLSSAIFFVVGIALLSAFAYMNLVKG